MDIEHAPRARLAGCRDKRYALEILPSTRGTRIRKLVAGGETIEREISASTRPSKKIKEGAQTQAQERTNRDL